MAKIANIISKDGYEWKFSTVGGVTRVNIESGEFNTQIKDLLDYCTIVLADSTETGKGQAQDGAELSGEGSGV